ncbi:MAG: hypothetical protein G8345_08760 [Magnetococcales bacterium]|nr:hypothetical protein [Magnetococcales bacterium]
MNLSIKSALLTVAMAVLTLTGCVPPGGNSAAGQMGMTAPQGVPEIDLVSVSHAIADSLVAELRKNHPWYHPRKPMLMTTLVTLSDLDTSSELGLLLSDQISSRLTQQGYAIVETKMRGDLAIRQTAGEFILSRDIMKLSQDHKAFAVVVGNYTISSQVIYLTARIIQIQNHQILASVNAKLPLERNTRELLNDNSASPKLRIVNQ